jgi:nucleoside-diphosphate-sugar epimerase
LIDRPQTDMRIILFGASGFLGSTLISSLNQKGIEVAIVEGNLLRMNSACGIGDSDKRTIVVSMAWVSNSKVNYLYSNDNFFWLEKHKEISEFCFQHNFELVIPGTCLEYSNKVTIPYIEAKLKLHNYLTENFPADKLLWLRYFYVFSLAHRRPGLIRDALKAKSDSKPFIISNLQGCHDYIEVRDAIAQTIELITGLNSGVWDIGAGRTRSNLDILSRIRNLYIVESSEVEHSNKPMISWEGSAKKLIPKHTQFTTHTNQFFSTLL